MLAAAFLALFAVAAVFATGPLQRGVIVGAGVTLTACAVAALVVLTSGSAPLMMGELAEQWTAQELRPLREHGWKLVNHFGLGPGDQDHVVVGPGGVVLVETRWGGTPWDVEAGDVFFRRALEQTAGNARQLSLWSGVAKHGRPTVEPVLVVWGPAARELREHPARRHDSGVVVMSGDQLRAWMLRRGRDRLTTPQVEDVVGDIDRHLVRRDERERLLRRPMPLSLAEMAKATVVGLGLAAAAFVLSSWLLQLLESLLVWLAVGLALIGASELARRRSRWRWEARTFQFALGALYLLTAAAVIRAYVLT
jgi:Nuclease-related domain